MDNEKIKIIIDPGSNYLYGSYYVQGLKDLYGAQNIHFSVSPFRGLDELGNDMRFIVNHGDYGTKCFLHLNDDCKIKEKDYNWCDVYGSVNANYTRYPSANFPKLKSLVPSYGIRIEESAFRVMQNSIARFVTIIPFVLRKKEWNKQTQKQESNALRNVKHFFTRRYKAWKNRLPLSVYTNDIPSDDNYIFFLSTLWFNDDWNNNDERVNLRRAHFIRACKLIPDCKFDGGLLGDASSSNEKFADVLTMQREAFPDWMEKTKHSALVFNTPAFHNCHGWKLGEYLALGKCIVSTKLSNDLPYPLEHGKNIHFVENTVESMREAIEYILAHPDYRHRLEQGAREYWEKYGTPEASLRLLRIE